jgi:hypothetical protein
VLEARERPGGRAWTIRAGDTVVETDSTQRVAWDRRPDLYLNAGPARISQHHSLMLGYCRELGVPLEVLVNDNRAALLQDDAAFGGRPVLARRVVADTRGGIAALAAGALPPGGRRSPAERRLRALLRGWGALRDDLAYAGSERAGYEEPPGPTPAEPGRRYPTLSLDEIAGATSWPGALAVGETWDQAGTMLQPVGGMDAIPKALARALGSAIRYRAEVVEMRRVGPGARVTWRDGRNGTVHALDADFVICTIPLPVLRRVESDFPPALQRAIAVGADAYVPAVKVAFQPRHHPDLVSVGRPQRRPGHPARRLHLDDRDRPAVRGDAARRAPRGGRRRRRAPASGLREAGRPGRIHRVVQGPVQRRRLGGLGRRRLARSLPRAARRTRSDPLRGRAHELPEQLAGGRGAHRAGSGGEDRGARAAARSLSGAGASPGR